LGVPLMVDIDWNLERGLMENLSVHLGVDLRELIDVPREGLLEGDRVIYVGHGEGFKRRDPKPEGVGEFLRELAAVMDEAVGKGRYKISFEMPTPPQPGGEPKPRMIDVIPDFVWWREHVEYARSPKLLPRGDWRVDWLLGVLFKSEEADMVYLDFRDPKVKVVVSGCFYSMHDSCELEARRRNVLVSSLRKAKKLKERYQSNPHVKWVKIVFAPDQEEVQKMIITVMDPAGMLTTSESQIPG